MADNKGVATMAATAVDTAKSLPMSGETRGHAIKTRRLAHGIKSLRAFAEASGVSREAITAAEDGSASAATYDRLEAWLDSFEAETGAEEPRPEEPTWPQVDRRAPAVPTVIKIRNDLGEVVIEAAPGVDRAQLVADAEALLMALVRVNRQLAAQEPETPQSDS